MGESFKASTGYERNLSGMSVGDCLDTGEGAAAAQGGT